MLVGRNSLEGTAPAKQGRSLFSLLPDPACSSTVNQEDWAEVEKAVELWMLPRVEKGSLSGWSVDKSWYHKSVLAIRKGLELTGC